MAATPVLAACKSETAPEDYEQTMVGTWVLSAVGNGVGPPFVTLALASCGDDHTQPYQEQILGDTLSLYAENLLRYAHHTQSALNGVPRNGFDEIIHAAVWYQFDSYGYQFYSGRSALAVRDTVSGITLLRLRIEPDRRLAAPYAVTYRCPGVTHVDSTRDVTLYYTRL